MPRKKSSPKSKTKTAAKTRTGKREKEAEPAPGRPVCPECGSTRIRRDYTRGEVYCEKCGTVIEENIIDSGPEWRAFDASQREKRVRTGAPIRYTLANKGLSTEIDMYYRDFRGVKISAEQRAAVTRMRKWHKRTSVSSSMERNLTVALNELERISSLLGLSPNLREAAALLYRKAVSKGLIRGRLIESVVAAVVYIICRQYNIPRTLDEIAEVSGMSKKEIGRVYRFLKADLGISMPLTNPVHYVPRFASELKLSG